MPAHQGPANPAGPFAFPEDTMRAKYNCPWFEGRCITDRYDHHETEHITAITPEGQPCELFIAKNWGHDSQIWLVVGSSWTVLSVADVRAYAAAMPQVAEALREFEEMIRKTWR
jgi:hypothetical protein